MSESYGLRDGGEVRYVANAAMAGGEVRHVADGRAAVKGGLKSATSGEQVNLDATVYTRRFAKATDFSALAGGRAYFDHSENKVTYRKVNDEDYYLGRFAADAAQSDTECEVTLNIDPRYDVDLVNGDAALQVATGTAAAGGFGIQPRYGSAIALRLTATNEAQCLDLLSVDRWKVSAKGVAEFIARIAANGSTSDVDLVLGIANGTSTSDPDAIAESVFVSINGGSTTINAESDDGTTEVNATDTTKTFSAGSAVANRKEIWIDFRDYTNIKIYVDGVRVLSGSTFTLAAATGPMGLLVLLEKASGTATAGPVYIDAARVRLMDADTA